MVTNYRLDENGLERLFGELEARIMESVWSLGQGTVSDVLEYLRPEDHHYKTVMTVMNRLVEKGLLQRKRNGRAFVYRTSEPRSVFMEAISNRVATGLVQDFGTAALSSFINAVEQVDPAQLEVLERLVRDRLDARNEPNA